MSDAALALIAATAFGPDGLVPAIAQDVATGVVRMFAFTNAEALRATFATGQATFWSRSRRQLWRKGSESGNVLHVREVRLDCDGDAILYLCQPEGPSCHTGRTSCFYRGVSATVTASALAQLNEDDGPAEPAAAILPRLAAVVKARRLESPDRSYVASLLGKGLPKINAKILEEAGELAEALDEARPGDEASAHQVCHEAADLIFHALCGLEAVGVPLEEVFEELRRRFGTSGHVEKAARKP